MDENDFDTEAAIHASEDLDSTDDSPWDESWDDDWDDDDPTGSPQSDTGGWDGDDFDALGRTEPLEGI